MTPSETTDEKRCRSYWGFVLWPFVILLLYALSEGPAHRASVGGHISEDVLIIYKPLNSALDATGLRELHHRYLRLWSAPLRVVASNFRSPRIERELKFYVANFSTNDTDHFYVGPTKLDRGELVTAWVYWKEERTLMPYTEMAEDAPEGAEIFAWGTHQLKLDQDTVDTPEDIAGSTFLETHRQWIDWMEQCISKGKLYVVTLEEASNAFPNTDRASADNE